VALARTDVSEELRASFIRVTRISELATMLVTASVVASSPILVTLMKEALSSFKRSALARATQHNIQEDAILLTSCLSITEVTTLLIGYMGLIRASILSTALTLNC
jgi:hypothetical protein